MDVSAIKKLTRIKIFLTNYCNYRCDYCMELEDIKTCKIEKVNKEYVVNTIKNIIETIPQKEFRVLYTGGEPLLEFQMMKEMTEELYYFARLKNKRLIFTIITNGVLVNEEVINHLLEYQYRVAVSCDGNEKGYMVHRGLDNVSNYYKTIETINRLKHTRFFHISIVATKHNLPYLLDGLKELVELGIDNFGISPVINDLTYMPDVNDYREFLEQLIVFIKGLDNKIIVNPPLENGWNYNNLSRRDYGDSISNSIEFKPRFSRIIKDDMNYHFWREIPQDHIDKIQAIVDLENEMSSLYKDWSGNFVD